MGKRIWKKLPSSKEGHKEQVKTKKIKKTRVDKVICMRENSNFFRLLSELILFNE